MTLVNVGTRVLRSGARVTGLSKFALAAFVPEGFMERPM